MTGGGKILNDEIDEQNPNSPIFEIKLRFFKLKKIPKIYQILQFWKSSNFHYWRIEKNNIIFEIGEFQKGEGQNFERRNIERLKFGNFEIGNIKITKDELFDGFIVEFIFSVFRDFLNPQNI